MNFSFQPVGNLDISVKSREHNKYDELIKYYSKKYNVDPLHLKTIIAVESNYNPKARNPKSSATGLTQIVSGTYKLIKPRAGHLTTEQVRRKLEDPKEAIETACIYLGDYIYPSAGTEKQVFYSYYMGANALSKLLEDKKGVKEYHSQAVDYVKNAMNVLQNYRAETGIPKQVDFAKS